MSEIIVDAVADAVSNVCLLELACMHTMHHVSKKSGWKKSIKK